MGGRSAAGLTTKSQMPATCYDPTTGTCGPRTCYLAAKGNAERLGGCEKSLRGKDEWAMVPVPTPVSQSKTVKARVPVQACTRHLALIGSINCQPAHNILVAIPFAPWPLRHRRSRRSLKRAEFWEGLIGSISNTGPAFLGPDFQESADRKSVDSRQPSAVPNRFGVVLLLDHSETRYK
jgi:hypothetical protein